LKIKNFLSKNKEYFITSAIIIAIVFSFYLLFGVFPFGTNTIAHYDMLAQTIPLSELIYDFFEGDAPLFYTTKTGLGANTFGYLVYFILSPFNLLTLIGGKGNVIYTVNVVFALKIICIGCIATWFIKKYFKKLSAIQIITLSIMYAFCGYMLFNFTYLSFLDYLIYAPLFIHFFNLLKNNGKIMPLSILIFFLILSCFSLGCFTLLYLLIIFIGYIFICTEKHERKDLIIKVISSCLIGIGLSSWLLLPAFIQYSKSSRNIGLSFFNTNSFTGTSTKIAIAITEIISVIFATIFLIRCDKKNKLNRFLIFVSILTLITIIFDEILIMLNGGSIMGYYSRFGFVGAILTLSLACKYCEEQKSSDYLNKSSIAINYTISIIICILYTISIFVLIRDISPLFTAQNVVFRTLFLYLLIEFVIISSIIYSFLVKKSIGKHFFTTLFIITICISFNNLMIHLTSGIYDTNKFKSVENLTTLINETDRVKLKTYDYIHYNAPTLNISSIDTFSSLVDSGVTNSLYPLGYACTINNNMSCDGTLLSDIIVGNKYILSQYELNYSHLKLIATDQFYLYENTLCSGDIKLINQDIELGDDLVENQEVLFKAFGGNGQLLEKYTELDYTFNNCKYNKHTKEFTRINDSKAAEIIINTNNLPKDTILYAVYNYEKENKTELFNDYYFVSNCILEVVNKTTISFYDTFNFSNYTFYTLDINKLNGLFPTTYSSNVEKNKITSTINLTEKSTVMLPYINIDGYTIKVNGKETQFTNKFLDFMTLELESGENLIEIEFKNPLLKWFIIGIIVSVILVILGIIIFRIRNKFNDKFINATFNGFSIIYLFVFILFPTIVFLMKLFNII